MYEWLSRHPNKKHNGLFDSGADVSLLPFSHGSGVDSGTPNLRLEDAQGQKLRVGGMRQAEFEFEHVLEKDQGCSVTESFTVSDVTNILLSFGRLLKIGWQFGEAGGDDQMLIEQMGLGPCAGVLKTPDGQCRIPVYYRKNSLSILARVHRVAGSGSTEDCQEAWDSSFGAVRGAFVKFDIDPSTFRNGWQFLENGNPVHRYEGTHFVDPGSALSRNFWRFRITIVLVGQVWEVIEHSQELSKLEDVEALISGLLFATTILTFPQRHVEPLSSCSCHPLTDDQVADIELPGDKPDQDIFSSEPQVPMELVHAPLVEPHGFAGGHIPLPESVWVNGKELTIESRVRDLQDACNYLGLNASGAKKKLYDRLAKYVEVQYQKDIGVISKNIEQQMLGPQPKTQGKASEMPSNPLEVEQREVTHLSFASWCDVCVRSKSRHDPTVHNADLERESRQGFHTFSLIGCFLDSSALHW